jgi:hypothetical protein
VFPSRSAGLPLPRGTLGEELVAQGATGDSAGRVTLHVDNVPVIRQLHGCGACGKHPPAPSDHDPGRFVCEGTACCSLPGPRKSPWPGEGRRRPRCGRLPPGAWRAPRSTLPHSVGRRKHDSSPWGDIYAHYSRSKVDALSVGRRSSRMSISSSVEAPEGPDMRNVAAALSSTLEHRVCCPMHGAGVIPTICAGSATTVLDSIASGDKTRRP